MGFNWDKHEMGGKFIGADEKAALKESGAPFNITGVAEVDGKFEHKREFHIKVIIPEGVDGVEAGDRTLTFAKGSGATSRDGMLEDMIRHFDEDGDELPAKLVQVGRAWLIKAAN